MALKKYELGIEIDGKTHWVKTNDVALAIQEFNPKVIKGKIVFHLERAERKISKPIFVARARRIFYNNLTAVIFARDLIRAIS